MGSDTVFPERLTRVSFASVLPSGPDRPCLVVIAGAELGQSVELDRDEVQIGRGDQCSLVINSDLVSRHHATVLHVDSRHVLRDENSTNGTFVNDQRVSGSTVLSDGDQIKIGRTVIKYTRSPLEVGYLEHVMGLATHDALTGIFNKRRFDDAFPAEVSRAAHGKRPLSLVLFDIDFFKSINDGHGHSAGDAVLRELTTVARGCIEDTDLLARVGGEEFAILIPTGLDAAREKAEALRIAVATHAFEWDKERIPVSVSLGVAELASGEDPQALYARADALLYKSKTSGRNRVSG
jgi:two-component system, cell cycle response regulator